MTLTVRGKEVDSVDDSCEEPKVAILTRELLQISKPRDLVDARREMQIHTTKKIHVTKRFNARC